jgi:hypothetical protein
MDDLWMLWYSGVDTPLADRVSRAAAYYQTKYGERPTLCLLSKDEPVIPGTVGGILCRGDDKVDVGHLLMGAE